VSFYRAYEQGNFHRFAAIFVKKSTSDRKQAFYMPVLQASEPHNEKPVTPRRFHDAVFRHIAGGIGPAERAAGAKPEKTRESDPNRFSIGLLITEKQIRKRFYQLRALGKTGPSAA
jgi:hypothetical protein